VTHPKLLCRDVGRRKMMIVSLAKPARIPRLHNGDRLTWAEFERRYDADPNLKKAELIDGVVYMPSPVRQTEHSRPQFDLNTCLGLYRLRTPGVEGGSDATLQLDDDNAPQPDGLLYILPEYGGRVRLDEKGYIVKAPDLIAEIAASSVSYDLHQKLEVYRRHRVREYIVWRAEDGAFDHFVLARGRFDRTEIVRGILRSVVFPGLWLAINALIKEDTRTVYRTLQKGIRSEEHRAFVEALAERNR
jgi:Uma2 family endonuclease